MPAPAYFLGLDASRRGLGLAVVASDGSVPASLRRAYPGEAHEPSDPADWWRAARTGIKELLRRAGLKPEQVRALGLTGDPHMLAALDKAGKPVAAFVAGPDRRADPQVDELVRTVGARNLVNLAGASAHNGAAAVKLMWLRAHHKRAWHDLASVLPAKDFLRQRLTGVLVTDANDAAATLLFNPRGRAWSKQLLGQLGFAPEWFPAVQAGSSLGGRVTDDAAREAGLHAGTPVVTGAGHAAALALACGSIAPGTVAVELGDTGCLFAPTSEPVRDPSGLLSTSCHTLPGVAALVADGLAGSRGLDWLLANVFASEAAAARRADREPIDALCELAAEIAPGADGLIMVQPGHRMGGLLGLDERHGRGHLVRAALEGGCLAVRQAMNALSTARVPVEHVVCAGPGATSHLWCQVLADALDRPVQAVVAPEAAALGSALLAACAVGIHKTPADACKRMVRHHATFHPRKAAAAAFADLESRLTSLLGAATPPPAEPPP